MSGTRVFIGRLTYKARESDVERFFKGYGRVRDISLKNGYGFVEFEDSRDADDAVYELNNREILGERVTVEHARGVPRSAGGGGGGSRSYRGDYGSSRSYDRYESRGGGGGRYHSSSRDDRSRVNYYESRAISKYGPPVRTKYRVVVENLSTRVSWQDLKDYLREAGEVTYADAHKHRQNEGVVDFATYDDMKRAIEKMDNTEINGRRIRLIEDTSFRSTSRSRSRSRSGGRSRSRSRSGRRSRSRSRSRSARRSVSRSRSPRRSRSRTPRRSRSRSRGSRSRSRGGRSDRSASKSRSRSRSKSPAQARSKSRDNSVDRSSPVVQQQKNGGGDDEKMEEGSPKAHSRASSRGAASRSRSRSASAE